MCDLQQDLAFKIDQAQYQLDLNPLSLNDPCITQNEKNAFRGTDDIHYVFVSRRMLKLL